MMSSSSTAAYSSALLRSKNKSVQLPMNIKRTIDLNTDLGQARDVAFFASEAGETLLSTVSSVNLPCFVHDGVPSDILAQAVKAKAHHCTLGAHIAYPDPMSLGYDPMTIAPEALQHWILVQLGALQSLLKTEHLAIEQVRPHGALYLALSTDEALAKAVVQAVQTFDAWLPIILPAGALTDKLVRETNAIIAPEYLVGRRYQASGLLALGTTKASSSGSSGGDWLNGSATAEQLKQLLSQKGLTSVSGTVLEHPFKTLHVSPAMPDVNWVAEKVQEIAQTLVPLSLVGIAESGWVQAFNDRREEAGDGKSLWEDY
jgi:5-oxoprolinase (ATP-hydrolysing) subunit A